MIEFTECNYCKKDKTYQCNKCYYGFLKTALNEIDNFINTTKNLENYHMYFNNRYRYWINKYIQLDLCEYTFIDTLAEQQMCVILDELKYLDYLKGLNTSGNKFKI